MCVCVHGCFLNRFLCRSLMCVPDHITFALCIELRTELGARNGMRAHGRRSNS